jgi:ABC-type sugar transport system ATPase subunit
MADATLLSVHDVSKRFGVVQALEDVSISAQAGSVLGLCGENGAGKSTLVKILMGVYRPDAGSIHLDGKPVVIRSTREGQGLGIALVSQELALANDLSVEDNIWLGSTRVPLLHRSRALRKRAAEAVATLGLDPAILDRQVGALSLAERQLVEIARNLCREARILILDEPTATLSDRDIAKLFAAIRGLAAQGCAVIYITHRLGEVFEICDRVTVLRNGRVAGSHAIGDIDRGRLIEEMIGRQFEGMYPPADAHAAEVAETILDVRGLTIPSVVDDVSFTVASGQIVGIAGQIGSGAAEVVRALAGLVPEAVGALTWRGRPLRIGSRADMLKAGFAFVSEDRGGEGMFRNLSIRNNLVVTAPRELSPLWLDRVRALDEAATYAAERVGIDTGRMRHPASQLSGGNQQKVVFGRFIDRKQIAGDSGAGRTSGLLLMNEPTRGVDVGARADLYRLMREYCRSGFGLVVYSSDLEELLGMSDSIITMYRGRVSGRYPGGQAHIAAVLADITHAPQAAQVAATRQ